MITYNWRICVSVVFGFIMCLAVPIAGIVWCVKRCKGKGGRQTREYTKGRSASLKRQISYSIFVVIWPLCIWAIAWNLKVKKPISQLMSPGLTLCLL